MVTKDIKSRVMRYFFLNPTARLRVRQIEREAGVPLPSAIRYTAELVKEGILKKTLVAGVTLFSADRSSSAYLIEKRLHNLRFLYSSGLVEFLVKTYSNPPIKLFGSYSRGEDTEESDIDLYVETPAGKIKGLERFENILRRKIQIFAYRKITDIKNKELASNILNGITVNGFVEVFS